MNKNDARGDPKFFCRNTRPSKFDACSTSLQALDPVEVRLGVHLRDFFWSLYSVVPHSELESTQGNSYELVASSSRAWWSLCVRLAWLRRVGPLPFIEARTPSLSPGIREQRHVCRQFRTRLEQTANHSRGCTPRTVICWSLPLSMLGCHSDAHRVTGVKMKSNLSSLFDLPRSELVGAVVAVRDGCLWSHIVLCTGRPVSEMKIGSCPFFVRGRPKLCTSTTFSFRAVECQSGQGLYSSRKTVSEAGADRQSTRNRMRCQIVFSIRMASCFMRSGQGRPSRTTSPTRQFDPEW